MNFIKSFLYSDINGIIVIVIMSIILYFFMIFLFRISGKRAMSEINSFDFLFTIIIGSLAATTILSKDIEFTEGAAAITTLIVMQFIFSKLDVKYKFISNVVLLEPTLVYFNGKYLEENLKKTRLSKENIRQKVRRRTGTVIDNVSAVIIESNGEISVITDVSEQELKNLKKFE